MDEPVPIPRRWLLPVVACAAALVGGTAGVGGALYFAERGPEGPQGAQGEPGDRGPRGFAGSSFDPSELESQITSVASSVDETYGGIEDAISGLDDLDFRLDQIERDVSDVCFELRMYGCL
jgi:hypothetical protein